MIVPELICSDIERSLAFYVSQLGFQVVYERPEERFALVSLGASSLMLEQPLARDRLFPSAPLEPPFGRGVNLEIPVEDGAALWARISGGDVVLSLEERWYGRGALGDEVHVRQFAIADPDGYVLRFSQTLATRPLAVDA